MQVLNEEQVVDVLGLWHAGHSKAEVARRVGVDAKTVRSYVAAAERAGRRPGGDPLSRGEWARLVREWFPLVGDVRTRRPTWQELDRHAATIDALLRTLPLAAVHRRLRDDHRVTASLASLRRYVHAGRHRPTAVSRPGYDTSR